MYKINTSIIGTAPLLQHKFSDPTLQGLMKGASKRTGSPDYSLEWMETMYQAADGLLFQPATHIEGSLVKAATSFKIKGARGKTWKDAFRAYVYVTPDEIPHLYDGQPIEAPGKELMAEPNSHLSVSIMRVKVQRAAVARARLQIAIGWQLDFIIEVHDEQARPEVVEEVLIEAGRAVGIGDYRPRYGRFDVARFEVE